MALPSLTSLAKVASISSSGIFAGYASALSDAALTAILMAPDEATMAKQWRIQFLKGFQIAMPATIINILSWSYLAYTAKTSFVQKLFIAATLMTGCGTAFAWTALRYINGALSIKADKLAGGSEKQSYVIRYSLADKGTKKLEESCSTKELAIRWKQYNALRCVVLVMGTVVGAYALSL
ncbi:hypothetical protein BT63DRAFT_417828 [Microthyrium microscopicum]|uniref:DUF1772-domain-containing protein n=1 Tax=Microthyrium microscopicum TaxID=703497 RepID=A0A6A6TWI8_9PEZI|nr:hypothetical protein BT63DRAFT_417828 [Microthyrium microscopicum]